MVSYYPLLFLQSVSNLHPEFILDSLKIVVFSPLRLYDSVHQRRRQCHGLALYPATVISFRITKVVALSWIENGVR